MDSEFPKKVRPGQSARPSSSRAKAQKEILWLLAGAFALALAVFGRALNGTFVFDDVHLPFADPNADRMPASFWIGGVRPALMATYWLNFLIAGTKPFSYHLLNIAFHAGTAVLMCLIFERLLEISSVTSHRRWHAALGATIFLLHPLQTESVDYIAGRSELVAGFFFAAAWLVFLNHFEVELSFRTSLKIVLLASIAILGKESAVSLPAVLVATDLFWADRGVVKQLRRRIRLYCFLLCGAPIAAFVILRSLTSGSAAGAAAGVSSLDYAVTQCRVIVIYIRLFLFPAGQNGDWQFPFFHSPMSAGTWLYALTILALFAVIVFSFRRARLLSFGLLVFLLMLLPTSSFVPIKDALAERRTYLPLAGLILAVLWLLTYLRLKTAALKALTVGALGLLALLSWQRSAVWKSDLDLWGDSVRKNPANPRAHFGLSSALLSRGACKEAVRELTIAQSQGYTGAEVQWNLAEAYSCDGKSELALAVFQSIARLQPSARVYNRIGYIEATRGDSLAALDAFENAVKIDPGNARAYAYRGTLKFAMNDLPGAREDFHRALELEPDNQIALDGVRNLPGARP